jgi:hypothetical protein
MDFPTDSRSECDFRIPIAWCRLENMCSVCHAVSHGGSWSVPDRGMAWRYGCGVGAVRASFGRRIVRAGRKSAVRRAAIRWW